MWKSYQERNYKAKAESIGDLGEAPETLQTREDLHLQSPCHVTGSVTTIGKQIIRNQTPVSLVICGRDRNLCWTWN